jgi:hypothetical protein
MGTPFDLNNQRTAVDPPTAPQLGLIRQLLIERDWRNADNPRYVKRVEVIAAALGKSFDIGEQVNAALHEAGEPPLPKPGASMLIDWLREQPMKSRHQDTFGPSVSDLPRADIVPAGRYAIDTRLGAINTVAFYKVDRPDEGRWAGHVFVKHVVGGDELRMSRADSRVILLRIAEAGAEAASARYGHMIGECGMCGRQLTNDESRARGIGPICAAKAGW